MCYLSLWETQTSEYSVIQILMKYATHLLVFLMGSSLAHAAVVAIDSVTLGGSNELLTATVGGNSYSGGVIADAIADNRNNNMTLTVGVAAPTGTISSSTDVNQGAAIDNDLLSGGAGGSGGDQAGGILSNGWSHPYLLT